MSDKVENEEVIDAQSTKLINEITRRLDEKPTVRGWEKIQICIEHLGGKIPTQLVELYRNYSREVFIFVLQNSDVIYMEHTVKMFIPLGTARRAIERENNRRAILKREPIRYTTITGEQNRKINERYDTEQVEKLIARLNKSTEVKKRSTSFRDAAQTFKTQADSLVYQLEQLKQLQDDIKDKISDAIKLGLDGEVEELIRQTEVINESASELFKSITGGN